MLALVLLPVLAVHHFTRRPYMMLVFLCSFTLKGHLRSLVLGPSKFSFIYGSVSFFNSAFSDLRLLCSNVEKIFCSAFRLQPRLLCIPNSFLISRRRQGSLMPPSSSHMSRSSFNLTRMQAEHDTEVKNKDFSDKTTMTRLILICLYTVKVRLEKSFRQFVFW